MAKVNMGGTVIIPTRNSTADRFLQEISAGQHIVDQPLTSGSLLTLFNPARPGHDGAILVEIFGRDEPWIRFSQIHFDYVGSKFPGRVENRGTRHNSAFYASTRTASLIIVVSQEHATISIFHRGLCYQDLNEADVFSKINSFINCAATLYVNE